MTSEANAVATRSQIAVTQPANPTMHRGSSETPNGDATGCRQGKDCEQESGCLPIVARLRWIHALTCSCSVPYDPSREGRAKMHRGSWWAVGRLLAALTMTAVLVSG